VINVLNKKIKHIYLYTKAKRNLKGRITLTTPKERKEILVYMMKKPTYIIFPKTSTNFPKCKLYRTFLRKSLYKALDL